MCLHSSIFIKFNLFINSLFPRDANAFMMISTRTCNENKNGITNGSNAACVCSTKCTLITNEFQLSWFLLIFSSCVCDLGSASKLNKIREFLFFYLYFWTIALVHTFGLRWLKIDGNISRLYFRWRDRWWKCSRSAHKMLHFSGLNWNI